MTIKNALAPRNESHLDILADLQTANAEGNASTGVPVKTSAALTESWVECLQGSFNPPEVQLQRFKRDPLSSKLLPYFAIPFKKRITVFDYFVEL